MKNPVDSFAAALRAARAKRHLTQQSGILPKGHWQIICT